MIKLIKNICSLGNNIKQVSLKSIKYRSLRSKLRFGLLIFILIFFAFSQCLDFNSPEPPPPVVPLPIEEDADADEDGIIDGADLCPMGVTFTSSSANDADNDGCRDSDEDLCLNYSIDNTNPDMDGICDSDARDLCPGDDSGTSFTATSVDADNDGCEDGAGNEDKCGGIDGNAVSNEDGDGDGLCGELSATNTKGDNCPSLSNPSQENYDGDGFGDVCDGNIDNDHVDESLVGVTDLCDKSPLDFLAADDADSDGCEDGAGNEDKCVGNAVSNEDGDDDDLCGQLSATNTDGDSCPLLSNDGNNDHVDLDGDYEGNACDTDDDGDGSLDVNDIDDDGDGLIEIGVNDPLTNPGSITNMHNDNDGSHYNGSIATGCGGLNSITACNGYELVSDVTIGSGWNSTTPGPSHTPNSKKFSAVFDGNGYSVIMTE